MEMAEYALTRIRVAQLLRVVIVAFRVPNNGETTMTQSEQIRKEIMEMVTAAENQRQRPFLVVQTVSDNLAVPMFRVKKILEDLIKERQLVFTYRDPCSFVEIPVQELPRNSPPTKVVVDSKGNPWICNQDVDPSKDLAEQGCWQVREEDSSRYE